MLLMVEKGIKGEICHVIHQYMKANNKYMTDDKIKKSIYLKYQDVNNSYGWKMSEKMFVNGFKSVEDTFQFRKDFIENYNDGSDKGNFLEVDIQYPERLCESQNDLPFLSEKMRIEKVEKLVANLHHKKEYVIHIRNLKQVLNHGLFFKKVRGVKKWLAKIIH